MRLATSHLTDEELVAAGLDASKAFYTPAEAARLFGCSIRFVARARTHGQLASIRIGRLVRIPKAALTAFAAARPDRRDRTA